MSVTENSSPLIRDPWLDNAKAGLITLVVIGHMFAEPQNYFSTMKWIYDFIYFFHMPAFLLVSGYLMRNRIKKRETDKVINKNLVPYLSCQLAFYFLFALPVGGLKAATSEFLSDTFSFLEPINQLWYLLGLVVYYFICVSFKPEKKPVLSLVLAYLFSISLGFFRTLTFLRFTKIMCFFPFFLLGYLLTPRFLEKLKKSKFLPIVSLCAFGLLAGFVVFKDGEYSPLIYAMSTRYVLYPLEFSGYYPIIARMIFIPVAMVISVLYLTLVPRKRHFFTIYGERSLYVYDLHAIPAIYLRVLHYETDFYKTLLQSIPSKVLYLLFSLMIVHVCSSDIVVKWTKRFVEPDFDINRFTDYFKKKKKEEIGE